MRTGHSCSGGGVFGDAGLSCPVLGGAVRMRSRGSRHFSGSVLIAFGVVSALVQFVGQLFPNAFSDPGFITAVSLMFCLAYGTVRSWPKRRVRRTFTLPEMSVSI